MTYRPGQLVRIRARLDEAVYVAAYAAILIDVLSMEGES